MLCETSGEWFLLLAASTPDVLKVYDHDWRESAIWKNVQEWLSPGGFDALHAVTLCYRWCNISLG